MHGKNTVLVRPGLHCILIGYEVRGCTGPSRIEIAVANFRGVKKNFRVG